MEPPQENEAVERITPPPAPPGIIRGVVQKAAFLAGKVRILAILSVLAAMILWIILFIPFSLNQIWLPILYFFVLGLLLLPGGVQLLLYLAFRQCLTIPRQIIQKIDAGEKGAARLAAAVSERNKNGRLRLVQRLFSTLFELRGLVFESKGLLVQYAGLVRLFNPFMIAVYVVAAVTGLTLIGITIITSFLVIIF